MRIKKKQLTRKARIALILLAGVLFAASLWGVCCIYRKPATIDKQVPAYSFSHKGDITCQARMKPNMVFQETNLGPDQTIYNNLLESFNVLCSYQYKADKPARLKGTYSVTATLEAKDMWTLDFPLVPQTVIEETGQAFSFNREFPVNLADFHGTLKQVNEQLGVNARDPKIVIRENINIEAVTDEGTVREKLTPNMVIPLTTGSFKVEGELTAQKAGALNRTVSTPNPVKEKLIYVMILAVTLGLLLILSIVLTQNKIIEEEGPRKKEMEFWKKYGERVVRVTGGVLSPAVIALGSMDDLMKVADELGKPVIYRVPDDIKEATACYVFDGPTAYHCGMAGAEGKACHPAAAGISKIEEQPGFSG